MKRTITLLLGCAAAPAFAGPPGDWVELDYGTVEGESEWVARAPTDDERSQRLAGQVGGEQGMFLRYDFRRDSLSVNYSGQNVGGTPFDLEPVNVERRRQFMGLSIGRTVPLGESVRLTGEIGYGRIEHLYGYVLLLDDPSDDVAPMQEVDSPEYEQDTPFVRLAFGGPAGPFDWNLEAEYMDSAPQPVPFLDPEATDSELWWNARFGYDITPSWNIGVRYADAEFFSATTLSLRWQL